MKTPTIVSVCRKHRLRPFRLRLGWAQPRPAAATACFSQRPPLRVAGPRVASRPLAGPLLWLCVLLPLLFLLPGCVGRQPRSVERDGAWLNIGEIASRVTHEERAATVLDQEQDKGAGKGAAQEEPPAIVLGPAQENPFLKRSEPTEPAPPPELRGEGVLLNFDNADIYEVIQTIADLLDINYIIDPQVKGVVNIRSGKKIPIEYLYPVFKKILHINGLDIRSEGEYQYIYVAKKRVSPFIRSPEEIGRLQESSELVTQIIPVAHLGSGEALKLVQPYLSDHGQALDLPAQNMLIVTDFESKVLDCVNLLARLDVSPLASLAVRMVKVENAPLFDIRDEIEEMMAALQINRQERRGVSIVALERVNSLLLVGNNRSLLDTVAGWIEELDVLPREGRDNIYIYNVRNSVASELAELVNNLIADKPDAASRTRSRTVPARTAPAAKTKGGRKQAARPAPARRTAARAPSSAMQFAGEPMLLADDSRNIILIRALPPDYNRLVKLLERLDNMPRQVLIEVLVAEISLTDQWAMGLEWWIKNSTFHLNGKRINQSIGLDLPQLATVDNNGDLLRLLPDFTYSFLSDSNNVFALLNMLAANDNLSVLSSPQVLVLNNETATVNVGDQVPIVTSQVSDTANNTVSNQTIQYKDTGIILNVTPRINYDGIILLDVDQQVSQVKDTTTLVGNSPTISTRQVKTKLAVKDGQTILIGGLIRRRQTNSERGVPFFKDVPVLGSLFKYQRQDDDRTELLIMITPYVIENEDVLDQYIREFREKTRSLRARVYRAPPAPHAD